MFNLFILQHSLLCNFRAFFLLPDQRLQGFFASLLQRHRLIEPLFTLTARMLVGDGHAQLLELVVLWREIFIPLTKLLSHIKWNSLLLIVVSCILCRYLILIKVLFSQFLIMLMILQIFLEQVALARLFDWTLLHEVIDVSKQFLLFFLFYVLLKHS